MITLKPGPVPDMRPGGRRPPQSGQVPLASGPPELPDRAEHLRLQPWPQSGQFVAFSPAACIQIAQLELRIAVPGLCSLALPHRSRSVSYGHAVRNVLSPVSQLCLTDPGPSASGSHYSSDCLQARPGQAGTRGDRSRIGR
jgi:hypothetical protein